MSTLTAVITNSEYLFQDFVLNHKHGGKDKVAMISNGAILIDLKHTYIRVTSVEQTLGKMWTGYHEIYDFHYQPQLNQIKDAIIRRKAEGVDFSQTSNSKEVY